MVMDHDDALERIEIAAAEPKGLERLMAGDTAEAAAVAGHLAGCASCTAELARIRRTAAVARVVVRTQADPALRERTLAFVRAEGVPRGAVAAGGADAASGASVGASQHAVAAASPAPSTETAASPAPAPWPSAASAPPEAAASPASLHAVRQRRDASRLRTAVTVLAAALVIAIGGGVIAYRSLSAEATSTIDDQAQEITVLEATTRATLAVTAEPDAERVALATTDGGPATGTLPYSPTTGELVAVASDLEPEPDGMEYGCWIEVDGTRTRIGKMYWAGDLWAWAGPVDGLADVPTGATFGVSLGPAGGGGDATPVLTGEL
jgi:hypothetical protein